MRALALDLGERRTGVAVSDEAGFLARGLTTLEETSVEDLVARIGEICRDLNVSTIIVGLPTNMDGSRGPAAREAERVAACLEEKLAIPAVLWDERLTTQAAERTLIEADLSRRKRKQAVDRLAATLILQSWLDARRRKARKSEAGDGEGT